MWKTQDATFGSQIRVNRGLYYHHGIYLSDEEVIHYTAQGEDGILDPSNVSVMSTDINEFLKGGTLEVRTYDDKELENLKDVKEIASIARNSIGQKGYNLISNNCEHFSNKCAFGKSESKQVDSVLSMFANMFD